MAATNKYKQIHGDSGEKPHTPSDQVKAFRKAARELGCEENEDRFKEALRAIAKPKAKKINKSN